MKTLTLLLITAGSIATAFAQANSADAPPQPPFLKRAPEKCQWQISTKSSGNAPGSKQAGPDGRSASASKVTTVVKNGNIVFETRTLENGSVLQFWRTGGIALMSFSGKPWMVVQGDNSFEDTDFTQSDFAGFDWISEANFTGRQKVSGRPCLLFKDRVVTINSEQVHLLKTAAETAIAQAQFARMAASKAGKSAADVPEPTPFREDDYKVEVSAYIDEETRLPIALVYASPKGMMARTYTFQALSQVPQMPAEVQKMLQAYQQRQKILGG